MAEVKWIKITTDIFDNRKIKQIESLPDGDTIIVIWVKLLCLAGDVNDSGMVYFTKEIPYTDQMLSSHFNRPLSTVQIALQTFEQFGMIELIDNILKISNWDKYQNIEGLEKIREQTRKRVERHREQKKLAAPKGCNDTCNVTVTHGNATDIDKDIDKERDIYTSKDCQEIIDLYNGICKSLPKCIKLSETRKRHIRARLKDGYGKGDFQKVFEKAEASDFLTGRAEKWKAGFDWLINENNMIKVLEGNYDNKDDRNHFTDVEF